MAKFGTLFCRLSLYFCRCLCLCHGCRRHRRLGRNFCRFLVDCCLPRPLPAPFVAKAVGADVAAAPSPTIFAAATADAVTATSTANAAASTAVCRYCCRFLFDCCMPQPLFLFPPLLLPPSPPRRSPPMPPPSPT